MPQMAPGTTQVPTFAAKIDVWAVPAA